MVNKSANRGRGRPRAYEPQVALERAMDAFWKSGYSGTSLDDIAAATGMNRPSLYAAFGNKQQIYLKALTHYWQQRFEEMRKVLASDRPLGEALMCVYEAELSIYFSGDNRPRGCFMIGTAVTEAVGDAAVRKSLTSGIHALDTDFEARIRRGQERGELKRAADPAALAALASATLHTIAIRTRAGFSRSELRELARKSVNIMVAALRI